MDFSWAEPFPDVYKICTLFQLSEVSSPKKFKYSPLPLYIQDGPQCGLVALAMLIGNPTKEIVTNLFELAKSRSYTNNGEIFSAYNMKSLAQEVLPESSSVELYSGNLNDDKIKEFLLSGGYILVPYDTEKDNSPGLQNGHKAHWAVLSGGIATPEDFFVIARHGKARNVAIWNMNLLAESNSQLFDFSPDRKLHDIEYKLPDGGISGDLGLNKKAVLILIK